MPLLILAGHHEEFQLHLFKFPHAEDEVARDDFVAVGLAHLRNAEGQFTAGGIQHIFEVHEDVLGGFRAQVGDAGGILHGAVVRFKHHVELAGWQEVFAAAVLALGGIGHFIRAHTGFAIAALGEGIVKGIRVAGVLEHQGMAEDGAIQAFDIVAFVDHGLPPGGFKVVFEFHAQRAEVIQAFQAAIDLG